jgi:hypothetical protein
LPWRKNSHYGAFCDTSGWCAALLAVALLLMCWASPVSAKVVVSDAAQSIVLSPLLMLYEDSTAKLSLSDIRALSDADFTPVSDKHLQLGYSESAFWLTFAVENKIPVSDVAQALDRFYISLKYPLLDSVDFFWVRGDDVVSLKEGDMLPFSERLFQINHYTFPFSLARDDEAQIFIRVASSSSLPLPLRLETEKAFIENSFMSNLLDGAYVGISVGLGIYNLFLFLAIRIRAYGIYVLMVFSIMMFNSGMSGLTFRFWPESIHFQQMNIYLFSFTSAVLVPLFGMEFLKTKQSFPRFHYVLVALVGLNLLVIPCLWWVSVATARAINGSTAPGHRPVRSVMGSGINTGQAMSPWFGSWTFNNKPTILPSAHRSRPIEILTLSTWAYSWKSWSHKNTLTWY